MGPSWQDLQRAVAGWEVHCAADPADGLRLIRQPAYFLVRAGGAGLRFAPMRHLIAWLGGTPFAQKNKRSINMKRYDPGVATIGLTRVDQHSPLFDDIWQSWAGICTATGLPLAKHKGKNPRNVRVFWLPQGI
ncbi:hypothetical protein [Salipiger abyssi]|uniref:hypothetical protein n=1 Tax=Salipiger abyssi TaxID=1250539 RepID=UPI0040593784